MTPAFNWDPTTFDDKQLQDAINYYQSERSRDSAVVGATPQQMAYAQVTNDMLQRLLQEQQKRQGLAQANAQQKQIEEYYNQGLNGNINNQPFIAEQTQAAENQRRAIGDIYSNELAGATRGIEDQYIPQKQRMAEDLAAQGMLRQANSRYSLNALEAAKNRNLSNVYSQLGAARGQALAGTEENLANRLQQGRQFMQGLNFNRAQGLSSALMGGNQFNQTFGLDTNKFNYGVGQDLFNNQLGIYGLNQAERLGNMQAEASKPTGLQQFGQVAGGIGSLLGGVGAVRSASTPPRRYY